MKRLQFVVVVTFCSLYAAQPIQPVFAEQFHLSPFQALCFTTLMMAPLGFAPLLYGYILEAFSAKILVRWAVAGLGILNLLFAFSDNTAVLLSIRALQGIIFPAIITSIVSYISYSSTAENVQQRIGLYIGTTIFGGFFGRFASGFSCQYFGWRFFFIVLGISLLLGVWLLRDMARDVKMEYTRPRFADLQNILRQRGFLFSYISIFFFFFVFAAMMNFLPFHVKAIYPARGEGGVGMLYLGYMSGMILSVNARRFIGWLGSVRWAIFCGIGLLASGCLFFLVGHYWITFFAMFLFCSGFFLVHPLLTGHVNRIARENKAIANGLYISFYYLGGTCGSFFPQIIYREGGWGGFLLLLGVMLLAALVLVSRIPSTE